MVKRGQITVFIIIAILILIVFALLFFIKQKLTRMPDADDYEWGDHIKEYVENCLAMEIEEGVKTIAHGGGYIVDLSSFAGQGFQKLPLEMDGNAFVLVYVVSEREIYPLEVYPPPNSSVYENANYPCFWKGVVFWVIAC